MDSSRGEAPERDDVLSDFDESIDWDPQLCNGLLSSHQNGLEIDLLRKRKRVSSPTDWPDEEEEITPFRPCPRRIDDIEYIPHFSTPERSNSPLTCPPTPVPDRYAASCRPLSNTIPELESTIKHQLFPTPDTTPTIQIPHSLLPPSILHQPKLSLANCFVGVRKMNPVTKGNITIEALGPICPFSANLLATLQQIKWMIRTSTEFSVEICLYGRENCFFTTQLKFNRMYYVNEKVVYYNLVCYGRMICDPIRLDYLTNTIIPNFKSMWTSQDLPIPDIKIETSTDPITKKPCIFLYTSTFGFNIFDPKKFSMDQSPDSFQKVIGKIFVGVIHCK